MIYFDTHFHYDPDETVETSLARMRAAFAAAGTGPDDELRVMAVGGGWRESLAAREFARALPHGIFAAGVHPQGAAEPQAEMSEFRELVRDPACRAVGELGLDYFYGKETRAEQLAVLEAFLELALAEDRPVILHCRDAEGRFRSYEDLSALTSVFCGAGGRAVVHCFTGSVAWAECFLAQGCMIGVTGIITFNRAANVREVAATVPGNRLLAETDSPYLAPVPLRGSVNTAGNLPLVIRKIALVRGDTPEHIADLTARNAARFYGVEL